MKLNDPAHLPVADNGIEYRIEVLAPSPAAADGKFVHCIAGERVRNVVVARPPLGPPVVKVLPIGRC
jgi:hypothetical protein